MATTEQEGPEQGGSEHWLVYAVLKRGEVAK